MPKKDPAIDKIKCPSCGELIPVNETLYHQIADKARAKAKAEITAQQKALAERERAVAAKEEDIDKAVATKLKAEKTRLSKEAEKKAREAAAVEIEDLKRAAEEKDKRIKELSGAELELRRQKRALEEKAASLELEVTRRIDAERSKIREETAKNIEEEHRLKDAEKDKKLQDALRVNEELRRKLEQGSQQTQGEVLELELEHLIGTEFPTDQVEAVPKGVTGADVLQRVFSRSGHLCGTIVWESKRTKAWNDAWVQKLKDDQRTVKADIAVLVSEALPKDVENFGRVSSSVWVADPKFAINLATALRIQLVEVATVKLAAVGKNEKMELLFRYLSGPEFKQRVEAIVEAFIEMDADLQEERRVAERRWAKREKQIRKVISTTSGMYGDFQGLVGSSLQAIPALSHGDPPSDRKESSPSEADEKDMGGR
jgi:hypothetical protein